VNASDTNGVIEAVWKIEAPRLIAGLARIVRDVGLAEDLAQEALVAALQRWPESGIPDNPGAWLTATAKNRAMDHFRREQLLERKHEELGREMKSGNWPCPISKLQSTTILATTCCVSSSLLVTRFSQPKLGLHSLSACSAV